MMLGYWRQPEKTQEKITGGWLRTGDMGRMDKDGIFTFVARDDDVITSAGYRIGPSEIENCLMQHPRVQLAAVIELARCGAYRNCYRLYSPDQHDKLEALEEALRTLVKAVKSASCTKEFCLEAIPASNPTGKIMRKKLRSILAQNP